MQLRDEAADVVVFQLIQWCRASQLQQTLYVAFIIFRRERGVAALVV